MPFDQSGLSVFRLAQAANSHIVGVWDDKFAHFDLGAVGLKFAHQHFGYGPIVSDSLRRRAEDVYALFFVSSA